MKTSGERDIINKKGVVLRAYETAGKTTECSIKLFGEEIKAKFSPYEIKTLYIDGEGARETDIPETSEN
ncbi:MAG: hypothetical protein IJY62_05245 [Clostridia bacterium]|nr:hypothetical protein [Clostridia bacterium]